MNLVVIVKIVISFEAKIIQQLSFDWVRALCLNHQ